MFRSTQLLGASVLVSTLVALAWLQAPPIPAVIGALTAGLLIYERQRRAARRPANH
jgi:Kef-type K+ transport system membrane component KefB